MTDNKALFEALHLQCHPMVLQMCLGFVKGDVPLAHDLVVGGIFLVWQIRKGIRREMRDLEDMVALKNELAEEG